MILSELFPHSVVLGDPGLQVKRAVLDSREVKPGDLFCAIKGATVDGRDYIEQAVERGATAILSDSEGCSRATKLGVASIMFDAPGAVVGSVASRLYGRPTAKMWVMGVTGTNGKSSTAWWLAECLSAYYKTAVLGTIGNKIVGEEIVASTHTTQDAARLHWGISQWADKDVKALAMEVSSHALDQGRVNGIEFDVAIYTNLSRDHLDYHGTMESYAEAKRKLVTWPNLRAAVINLDDPVGSAFATSTSADQLITYSISNTAASLFSSGVVLDEHGIQANLHYQEELVRVSVPVFGAFNLSNLLAVAGALIAKGWSLAEIGTQFSKLTAVPGRMESVFRVDRKQVLVDYAHTPDALENAIKACRDHLSAGKLWVVFGCGGNRDQGKRPMMARVAEQGADRLVITSDNPRDEDPSAIIDEILAGLSSERPVEVIESRRDAIEFAVNSMADEDLLLIAGKGHETYQEIAGEQLEFDDRRVASEVAQ